MYPLFRITINLFNSTRVSLEYKYVSSITLISFLIAITIVYSYRFVKDDTGNVLAFYNFISTMGPWRTLSYIASNEWLGYQPRSFFLTWWIQVGLIKAFGMENLFGSLQVYFAIFAALIHSANSILIYKISKKLTGHFNLSFIVACLYLVLPTASINYLISNNWFFLLPLFFLLSFSYLILLYRPFNAIQVILAIILLCCVMFSGEQLMAAPYYILAVQTIHTINDQSLCQTKKRKSLTQYITVIFIGLATYAFYIKIYSFNQNMTVFDGSLTKNIFDIPSLLTTETFNHLFKYTLATGKFIYRFFGGDWSLYGSGAIKYSLQTITLCIMATAFFCNSIYQLSISIDKKNSFLSMRGSAFLLGLFFVCMLPLYFGAISGNRPGPDDRYLMIPSLIIVISGVFFLFKFFKTKTTYIISGVIFLYFSLLTFHLNIDVWNNQRKLDDRLWNNIYTAIQGNTKYVLTINNDTYFSHRGLQRPYLSAAWTDFNADWGVTPRIKYVLGKEIELIHNLAIDPNGSITAIGYWGKKTKIITTDVSVVYFDDGPNMSDALQGKLIILSLEDYIKASKANKIPNRIIWQ